MCNAFVNNPNQREESEMSRTLRFPLRKVNKRQKCFLVKEARHIDAKVDDESVYKLCALFECRFDKPIHPSVVRKILCDLVGRAEKSVPILKIFSGENQPNKEPKTIRRSPMRVCRQAVSFGR